MIEIEDFNKDDLENNNLLGKINSYDNYNFNDLENWHENQQNLNDTLEYQDNLDYSTFNQTHYTHINNYFDLLSKDLSENYQCDSNQNFVYDDEEQNPIVPGLFPAMNINDPDKFLLFDRLPISPSFVKLID